MESIPADLDELSVGQVASRSGVNASTLHFYERKGLIESERTEGNQRRYHRDVLRRVAFIKASQRVGIPLASIKSALDTLPRSTPTKADWERLSKLWKNDLDCRIRQLEQLRDQLTSCIGCGCLSLKNCSLANPDDVWGGTQPKANLLEMAPERNQ